MSLKPKGPQTDSEEYQRNLGRIFRECFDNRDLPLHPDITARDIDGWDSLPHIRLLPTIERNVKRPSSYD
jgi:acyl carrier protein